MSDIPAVKQTANTTWHERAAELRPDGRAFVAGQRVASLAGATFEKRSPIDGRLLAPIADGRRERRAREKESCSALLN